MVDVRERNNVRVRGEGEATLVFAHGFGCDQNMWRFLAPHYEQRFRVVLYDLVGSGRSHLPAYEPRGRHASLHGHADDLLEIIDACATGRVVFVGHSVSAMIGVLADLKSPGRFAAHVMVGPSPCYVNDGNYLGGFTRVDIDSLLETMEGNYLGWASNMAPAIMGAPGQPELGVELTNSFCRTDPDIAQHFARVTFLSDNRDDVARLTTPTLILQCSDDIIAPLTVGEFLNRRIEGSTLRVIENIGHCPHLSAPVACIDAMDDFLAVVAR